jgi:hypothetical protein
MDEGSGLVYTTIIINSVLGVAERIFQIIFYCKNKKDVKTLNEGIRYLEPDGFSNFNKILLTFTILPSGIHFLLILLYTIFHNEEMLTVGKKIKKFFLYLFSSEFLFPIGIQYALRNKFSDEIDTVLNILKVLNLIHIMFISIPQILAICLFSSLIDKFRTFDIICLALSCVFITWTFIYYFICINKEEFYDNSISKCSKKLE